MRVIIAGSRDFNDYALLIGSTIKYIKSLKELGYNTSREVLEIVSGTANGADKLGEKFATQFNLKLKKFPAKWNELGKRAGYVRNKEMAIYASEDSDLGVLIAFWDGESKGTKHMIDLAKKQGLVVFVKKF